LLRQVAAGACATVVDPEGEFRAVTEATGGLWLPLGDGRAGLNPVALAAHPGLPDAEGLAVLGSFVAAVTGRTPTGAELAALDTALGHLRADHDTGALDASALEDGPQPLLRALSALAGHPGGDTASRLVAELAGITSSTLSVLFTNHPALEVGAALPAVVCFDVRSVPDAIRPAVTAAVLSWAWLRSRLHPDRDGDTGEAGHDRTVRPQLLLVDEAHLLLTDPAAAGLLAQFARRARKYGIAMELVTQRLEDFLTTPAGQAVLSNTAGLLLLGCEDHDRSAATTQLGLTAAEARLLRPDTPGRGLLITPTDRRAVQVLAADHEAALAGVGPRVTAIAFDQPPAGPGPDGGTSPLSSSPQANAGSRPRPGPADSLAVTPLLPTGGAPGGRPLTAVTEWVQPTRGNCP
jgi:type IV secretory pathway VirB4 component